MKGEEEREVAWMMHFAEKDARPPLYIHTHGRVCIARRDFLRSCFLLRSKEPNADNYFRNLTYKKNSETLTKQGRRRPSGAVMWV